MERIAFQIDDFFFSWDERKSQINLRNHGVAFQEAATCWLDEHAVEVYDEEHSEREIRWLVIGQSDLGRLLTCWYSERRLV